MRVLGLGLGLEFDLLLVKVHENRERVIMRTFHLLTHQTVLLCDVHFYVLLVMCIVFVVRVVKACNGFVYLLESSENANT